MSAILRVAAWAAIVSIAAAPAFAQKPPKIPPGQIKKLQPAPGGTHLVETADAAVGAASTTTDVHVRSLGAWLDDARVLPIGEGWVSVSLSRWSTPIASGADTPGVDVSVGLTRRVHLSVSAPYFRASDLTGTQIRGMGDMYIATKIQLRDPDEDGFGLALGPTFEVASAAGNFGTTRRVHWLLPLNMEWQDDRVRVYGSAGYFSRGVLSAAAAIERALSDRVVVTGALSHAYSIDRDALGEEIGLGRRRVDLSGSLAYVISPALVVFGSLGRTVSRLDDDATRLLATVGVSMNISGSRTQ